MRLSTIFTTVLIVAATLGAAAPVEVHERDQDAVEAKCAFWWFRMCAYSLSLLFVLTTDTLRCPGHRSLEEIVRRRCLSA